MRNLYNTISNFFEEYSVDNYNKQVYCLLITLKIYLE